jgi:hypothetical protein
MWCNLEIARLGNGGTGFHVVSSCSKKSSLSLYGSS